MSARVCPYCKRPMEFERKVKVTDASLIEALRHSSPRTYGRNSKPSAPWLYAAAAEYDSRKADFDKWFVTGPDDRKGYIKGPFPHDQVKRVAATGGLRCVCRDDEQRPIAYELAR